MNHKRPSMGYEPGSHEQASGPAEPAPSLSMRSFRAGPTHEVRDLRGHRQAGLREDGDIAESGGYSYNFRMDMRIR